MFFAKVQKYRLVAYLELSNTFNDVFYVILSSAISYKVKGYIYELIDFRLTPIKIISFYILMNKNNLYLKTKKKADIKICNKNWKRHKNVFVYIHQSKGVLLVSPFMIKSLL